MKNGKQIMTVVYIPFANPPVLIKGTASDVAKRILFIQKTLLSNSA